MKAHGLICVLAALAAIGCTTPAKHASRIETIRAETQALERETEELSKSIRKLSESLDALERKTDRMHLRYVQPRLNKEGARRIDNRLEAIGRRMGVIEMLGSGALSIKVLSGDGDIASAKSLSETLSSSGYRVKAMDFAPTPNNGNILVFATDTARPVAEDIIKEVGLKAEIRPLTWSTVFDIIFVTGKGIESGSRKTGRNSGK